MRRTMRWLALLTACLTGTVALAQQSHRVPAPACPWLARDYNCWARAMAEFDACAPPQNVRGTLYVDGICRYYDGTFLRSEVLQDPSGVPPREARSYELKFELLKVGKPCFSFRRRIISGGTVDLGHKPWPKEIETEIVTRHGTVRYVQTWDPDTQRTLWDEAQRAQSPMDVDKPSEPLKTYAWGEKSVGFLTCPDRSMVAVGMLEYLECPEAVPMRGVYARPDRHALEFAFVQPQWTKKSLACGVQNQKAPYHPYFDRTVILEAPVPAIPPREAGPVPERLQLRIPSP